MLGKLSLKQKEYVLKIGAIKAAELSELSMSELNDLGEHLNTCSKLGIEITEELSSFWAKIGAIAKEASLKFAEIGIKVAARILLSYIPIPL